MCEVTHACHYPDNFILPEGCPLAGILHKQGALVGGCHTRDNPMPHVSLGRKAPGGCPPVRQLLSRAPRMAFLTQNQGGLLFPRESRSGRWSHGHLGTLRGLSEWSPSCGARVNGTGSPMLLLLVEEKCYTVYTPAMGRCFPGLGTANEQLCCFSKEVTGGLLASRNRDDTHSKVTFWPIQS